MSTKQYTKGEKRRNQILKIAREQLIKGGYEQFVIRDIAAQAGMRLGNLQYYFATRDDLLEAVICAEAQTDLVRIHALEKKHHQPEMLLKSLCLTMLEKWQGEGCKIFTLMSFLATVNPTFAQLYTDIYNRFYAAIIPLLKDLNPGQEELTYRNKAMLITALIDGGAGQVSTDKQFAEMLAEQAVKIAF
ncbi:MAG: TetR/AcrR family transcriptional regulator [Pseudomonadales bacterium]|nr:TetR/AcrR family transcriptional regulator [Pseudomonadales bacterium]